MLRILLSGAYTDRILAPAIELTHDMPQVRKSILVPYSARRMFDLVADVPSYPNFMPWCGGARMQAETDGRIRATIDIHFRGVRSGFTTLNRHSGPDAIDMEFADGPFSSFSGRWRFAGLTGFAQGEACKVEFALDYEFSSNLLGRLIAPVFDVIATSFIDAFSARAEKIYG